MKTKLLLAALMITVFSFASTVQAQQVLKFTNKNETKTQATATLTFTQTTTVVFRLYGGTGRSTDFISYSVGGYPYYLNGSQTQQVTQTFTPGTYSFRVVVSSQSPASYYGSSIVMSYVESGNATISTVPGEGSLYCDSRY